jgi:hypothetical protein
MCVCAQVPFGALSDSTRAALAAGLESTSVEKQIENEGDDAVYALLPEVHTPSCSIPAHSENCRSRTLDRYRGRCQHQQHARMVPRPARARSLHALGKLPQQHARCQRQQHDKLLV